MKVLYHITAHFGIKYCAAQGGLSMKKKLKMFAFSMLIFTVGMCYHIYASGYLKTSLPVVADTRTTIELPIIMYHGITDQASKVDTYMISASDFESDLEWLAKNGYTTILPSQLIAYVEKGEKLPEKPVMLTFDDGYENNYTLAFPILKKHGAKALISVIGMASDIESQSQYKNQTTSNLSWNEIKQMTESKLVEIGNHTYALHNIDQFRKGADRGKGESQEDYEKVLSDDLSLNQKKIAEATGNEPLVFAWPYGAYPSDKSADKILKKLGFKMSLTSYQRKNTIEQGNTDNLFGLKRFLRTPDFDIGSII